MIFDLHNDFLTASIADRNSELETYSAARLRGCLFAVWTSELGLDYRTISDYKCPDCDFFCRMAIEDLGALECEDYSKLFRKLRPAYASLTWNGENPLAGGTGRERPLTAKGRRAVAEMNAAAVPLDLSHLSDSAFYDAVGRAERIVITHTASRKLCDHPRCVTDEMAKLVANRGGLIGVAAVPNFLDDSLIYGENCDRAAYARHIAHFAELLGAEYVAIGTDFNGAEYFPEGMTTYADFAALKNDLKKLGFSNGEIDKIFYENAEKYFRPVQEKK